TASTRPANRRSHPRTVCSGRPNPAAIRRYPTPSDLAVNAAPITTTVSARRSSNPTGSSTCVAPQPTHRARRGRTRTTPPESRTARTRACPQPASPPAEHPGQTIRPSTSRCSTTAGSPPTVTNDASVRHRTALPWNPARDDGRAVAHHNVLTVPPETNKDNHPVVVLSPSSPSTPPDYPNVLILTAVEQSRRS